MNIEHYPHDDTFRVSADGPALPYDGNAPLVGRIPRSRAEIAAAVHRLQAAWLEKVVRHYHSPSGTYTYDGLPKDVVGAEPAEALLGQVGIELARAGDALYRYLFAEGDHELTRLYKALSHALRSGPQTITVTSSDLFVPWGLLYIPPSPNTRLMHRDAKVEWAGFVGYSHLVEHCLGAVDDYTPFIAHGTEPPKAGLHFDLRLEKDEDEADDCPLRPVRAVVETHAVSRERTTKPVTAEALCESDDSDHVIVFAAHGTGIRTNLRGMEQAQVTLTDDDPIYAADLEQWASHREHRLPDPLCFMMVCEGGRAGMCLHEGLARPLFNLGVGCLIGPQIEVPETFGSKFTCRFFEEFFKGECAAPVVRDLVQEFVNDHATPLGLVFTLIRGIDNCLITDGQRTKDADEPPCGPDRH
ncbi:hypothetical protein ABT150_46685 [Streptomyces mirabilis]|uniref:hypothetical protein n=1 Tax=Streptomyces mirabilis TaxID=68239 RepID=UPI003319A9F3